MNTEEFVADIKFSVLEHVNTMRRVRAHEMGLDDRAGYLYVDDHTVAVHVTGQQPLEYYGGFEYVSKDCVFSLGEFTFYSIEDSRVARHIEEFLEGHEEEEMEEV